MVRARAIRQNYEKYQGVVQLLVILFFCYPPN